MKISNSCVFIGYRGLSSWCVSCRCSIVCLSLCAVFWHSLVGSIAIHCFQLPAGTTCFFTGTSCADSL